MSQSSYSLSLPASTFSSTHSLPTTTYPAPPPTTHTLTQKDRARLVKSTRKLTSVLGSTPQIASAPAPAALSIPPYTRTREPPTPRTKKSRRTGRVFTPTSMPTNFAVYNSSDTSLSSFDYEEDVDAEAEKEGYVVVRRGGATGYHYHHLDISLPANHRSEAIKVTLAPSEKKGKKGGKALPPPLLLRLRAVPVDNHRDSVLSTVSSVNVTSPLSPTFSPPPPPPAQSASQKVKKLNKLSRTFGEPVPPELVFPSQSRGRAPSPELLKKVEEKPQGPRLSARERRVRREEKKRAVEPEEELDFRCRSPTMEAASSSAGVRVRRAVEADFVHPPLPRVGLAMALPTPPATQTTSTGVRVTQTRSQSSTGLAQTSRRAPRPRSLTLIPPLPTLPSLPLPAPPALPLPVPPVELDSPSSDSDCSTPPTSTDDLPASLKEILSSPTDAASRSPYPAAAATPLSPRHAHSQSTPNLPRPRTSSSGASRTSEDKTHHRIPIPRAHARSKTLDNRSSRAFYGVSSAEQGEAGEQGEEDDEEGYGHRREREWSGEWNVRVGDVRRLLRELKAR